MDLLMLAQTFFSDVRTQLLFILIGADLISGVISALMRHAFQFERLGDWLLKDVVYAFSYFLIYLFSQTAVQGALGGIPLSAIVDNFSWGTAIVALIASIGNNLREAAPPRTGEP